MENIVSKKGRKFVLNSAEDFEEIFNLYPNTRNIALRSKGLEDAANKIAQYFSSGSRIDSWTEGTIMKSLKHNVALAAGMAVMPVSTGNQVMAQMPHNDTVTQEEHKPAITTSPATSVFGKKPEDKFLWNIMQIESSGGKNTNHEEVKSGPLKGHTAMGRWGLMPTTVTDVLNRVKAKGALTEDMKQLYGMDRAKLNEHFVNNPSQELHIARFLARHVLNSHKNDYHRAAYSWLHGHNLTTEKIPDESINGSDYVNKYKLYNQINPYKKDEPVKKSIPIKKESVSDFKGRFKSWSDLRDSAARKPIQRDSTFTPDPGRLREKKLDEVKPTSGIRSILGWIIDQAKKDNKKA